jgi:predicted pyridoxine 5'-phosphate oxidase superfamily flavin-nucleotide-binding protein
MMFMIPGFEDILRVNGRATIEDDADLRSRFEEFGKPPITVMRIAVDEVFFHCPKAVMRASLWAEDAQAPRETLPTLADMVSDQLGLPRPGISADEARARAQAQL